ncbi:hypothetical protein ACB092_05G099100 [Castanea dentata]
MTYLDVFDFFEDVDGKFDNLIANVNTISGSSNLIEGSGRAIIMLPKGTKLCIDDALYSSKSSRSLLIFKDIRYNGYYIETNNEGSEEFLYITSIVSGQKLI